MFGDFVPLFITIVNSEDVLRNWKKLHSRKKTTLELSGWCLPVSTPISIPG